MTPSQVTANGSMPASAHAGHSPEGQPAQTQEINADAADDMEALLDRLALSSGRSASVSGAGPELISSAGAVPPVQMIAWPPS